MSQLTDGVRRTMEHPVLQYFDKKIAECEQKLKDAEDKALRIEGELFAYKRAKEEIKYVLSQQDTLNYYERGRDFSENWKTILRYIYDNDTISISDVEKFSVAQSFDMQRGAIRSQLHVYTRRGLLERVESGQYRLTEGGKAAVETFDAPSNQAG